MAAAIKTNERRTVATVKAAAAVRGYNVHESTVGEFDSEIGGRVDRARKIIFGVKVIGLESVNTARLAGFPASLGDDVLDLPYGYDAEALRTAIPLYESARVFFDHPQTGIDSSGRRVTTCPERKFRDHVGRLINLRFVEQSGLFADLEYLESEPLTAKLVEAAERMPEQIALSHRAFVHPVRNGNRVVVDRVLHVTSVDIVTENPGTTETLFESAPNMMNDSAVPPGGAPQVKEDADMGMGGEITAPVDPKAAIKQSVKDAVGAIIDSEEDATAATAKIKTILENMLAMLASLSGGSPAPAAPAAGAESESAAGPTAESQSAEALRLALAKTEAVGVLETAGVRVTTSRISMLAHVPQAERAAIIEQMRQLDAANVLESGHVTARSGGGGPVANAGAGAAAPAFSEESFLAGLK